jgi:hypothetical protein
MLYCVYQVLRGVFSRRRVDKILDEGLVGKGCKQLKGASYEDVLSRVG